MAFKHLVLGLLTYKPRSGYSLRRVFFQPLRPSLPYLYRTISNMADEGLITFERVEHLKLPAQNVCHITATGRNELERWLKGEAEAKPVNEPFLQKLLFSGVLGNEQLINHFEKYKDQRQEEWNHYESEFTRRTIRQTKARGNPLDKLCWDLFLDYITSRRRFEEKWIETSIQRISNLGSEDITTSAVKNKLKTK